MKKIALLGALALALGAPAFAADFTVHQATPSPELERPPYPHPIPTPEPDEDCPDQDEDQDQDDKNLVQCFAKSSQGTIFHKVGHGAKKTQWKVLHVCRKTSHSRCAPLGCRDWNPANAE